MSGSRIQLNRLPFADELRHADVRLQMPGLRKRIVGRPHIEGARIGQSHMPLVPKPADAADLYVFYRPYGEEELSRRQYAKRARTGPRS